MYTDIYTHIECLDNNYEDIVVAIAIDFWQCWDKIQILTMLITCSADELHH